jgi:hypothetical protein
MTPLDVEQAAVHILEGQSDFVPPVLDGCETPFHNQGHTL